MLRILTLSIEEHSLPLVALFILFPKTLTPSTITLHYNSFGRIVLGEGEGRLIAEALGNKKAAILANHGLFTTGKSIESTVFWFISLDTCCRVQLLADAAAASRGGETVKIADKEAAFTFETVGTEVAGWFSAKLTFNLMERECGQEYAL